MSVVTLKAGDAEAGICQATSTTWKESIACPSAPFSGSERGDAWGAVEKIVPPFFATRKVLYAWLINGQYVIAQGINSSGGLISGCVVQDATFDLNPARDSSGCDTAVRLIMQVGF